jgi:hypothetical protein
VGGHNKLQGRIEEKYVATPIDEQSDEYYTYDSHYRRQKSSHSAEENASGTSNK